MLNVNHNIENVTYVYAYLRVSTRIQASNDKNGLEKQLDACTNYAKKVLKKNIYECYTDIGTTYKNKCILTHQNKMLRQIIPNSVILIHSVSRIGRDLTQTVKFLSSLKKKGVKIISITDNACYGKTRLLDKKFYYRMIHAEEKSDIKSERMTLRIMLIKRLGGYFGRPPYGYQTTMMNNVPMLTKNTSEQTNIKTIKSLFAKRKSVSTIVNYLNSHNRVKRGKEWTYQNVKSVNLNKHVKTYVLNENTDEDLLQQFSTMNAHTN